MSSRAAPAEIRLPFFHHVELETDDVPFLAFTLCRALGVKAVAWASSPRGDSIWLQSCQAVLICSPRRRNGVARPVGEEFVSSDSLRKDRQNIRVSSIGFQADDLSSVAAHVADTLNGSGDNELTRDQSGLLTLALPMALGSIKLRFARSETVASRCLPSGAPIAIAGYEKVDHGQIHAPATAGGVIGIDHIAVNVTDAPRVCGALEALTGWAPFRTFTEEGVQRPLSALTLSSPTAEGLLTVVQPTERDSIFQKTLEANAGASVHHIALRCENLLDFADTLSQAGAWRTMPRPSSSYYEEIRPLAQEFLDEDSFKKLQHYGMLLDFENGCALIQVFLPYLETRPGAFFELVERLPPIEEGRLANASVTSPGCGGFGDRNVRHLYDCLVDAVDQPPLVSR